MADIRYSKLVERIFWFTLPLVIGLLTWLVVNTYSVKEQIAITAERNNATLIMQEKIYTMASDNNKILIEKADKIENEHAHQIMFQKLDNLQLKVDRIFNQDKRAYGIDSKVKKNDTLYFLPLKDLTIVSTDYNKNNN